MQASKIKITQYKVPKRVREELDNWARWCNTGDSPLPVGAKQAAWVKFVKPEPTDFGWADTAAPVALAPVCQSRAQRVHDLWFRLPVTARHVMTAEFVGLYLVGRPLARDVTVRLMNEAVQFDRLVVPKGWRFTLPQYEADLRYIAQRVEVACVVR